MTRDAAADLPPPLIELPDCWGWDEGVTVVLTSPVTLVYGSGGVSIEYADAAPAQWKELVVCLAAEVVEERRRRSGGGGADLLTDKERQHVEDVRSIVRDYTFGARLDVLLEIVDRLAPNPVA